MKRSSILLLAAAIASPSLAAPDAPPRPGAREEVSIPFVTHRGAIRTFEAVDDSLLYLQDRRGRWYRLELGGSCFGLKWAHRIGYDTRGGLSLDRFGAILVDGERCPIVSLVNSDPPPRKARGKKRRPS